MRPTWKRNRYALLSSIACAGILLTGTAATAQTTKTDQATEAVPSSDDIVVTATKQGNQTVQNVPLSISVISGETLLKQGAVSYRDYLTSLPGVSYQSNGGYKDKIAIRGVADAISSRTNSTTGIYIDEAPITEVDASLADIGTYDLDHVEVLRGPQGTLYGASSMGGTVRLITRKPDLVASSGEVNAAVDAVAHSGDIGRSVDGFINLPIRTDQLALRVTAGYRHTAGFIDNVAVNAKDVNSGDSEYVRAQLRYAPTDRLNVLLQYQYKHDKRNGNPDEDIALGNYSQLRYYPEYQNVFTSIYGLTVDYKLGGATITSATNYIDKHGDTLRQLQGDLPDIQDVTGTTLKAGTGVGLIYSFPNRLFSQELRIASAQGKKLHWLVGAYYSNFSPNNLQREVVTGNQLPGVDLYTSATAITRTQIAAFGEVGYDITPRLTATVGLRAFQIKTRSYNITSGLLNGGVDDGPGLHSRDRSVQQRYNLQYRFDEDHQLYAQAAQGFRPGGPLTSVSGPTCRAELTALGYASLPASYAPDKLWNYEIGSKNSFLDRHLTVNASAYRIDWNQIQLAQNLACGQQFIANAGNARITGGELEVTARPLDGLNLSASVGYVDSEFRETNAQLRTVKGAPLPGVPK